MLSHEFLHILMPLQNLDPLLESLLTRLNVLLPIQSASVWLMDTDHLLRVRAYRGYEAFIAPRLLHELTYDPKQESLWQAALPHAQPYVMNDVIYHRPLPFRHAQTWIILPLRFEGNLIGLITLESTQANAFSSSDLDQLTTLAPWLAIAIHNAGAYEQMAQMSQTLTHIHETERDRLADILHDEIADGLSLVYKSLRGQQKHLTEEVRQRLSQDIASLSEIAGQTRKISHDLGAQRVIQQFDLIPALQILFDNYSRQTGISVFFPPLNVNEQQVTSEIKLVLYRIVQEALANVAKHAGVEEVSVLLDLSSTTLTATIEDQGSGFAEDTVARGIGMMGMRQRASSIGGQVHVHSQIGRGTTVTVQLPITRTPTDSQGHTLNPRRLQNLVTFARLLGYIRYFYPGDEALGIDWERFAAEGVQLVEPAPTPAALIATLRRLFAPIAPLLSIAPPTEINKIPIPQVSGSYRIFWRHHGFGVGEAVVSTANQDETSWWHMMGKQSFGILDENQRYSSERVVQAADDPMPPPLDWWQHKLEPEIVCRFPLVLYSDTAQASTPALPIGTRFRYKNEHSRHLAAVILLWNVFQHFYPYFDVIATQWETVLPQALEKAYAAQTLAEFRDVIQWVLAQLYDGAARLHVSNEELTYCVPPFVWDWIEGQLIITGVAEPGEWQIGDRVLEIDQQPIASLIETQQASSPGATAPAKRRAALRALWRGAYDSAMQIKLVSRAGQARVIKVLRRIPIQQFTLFTEPRPSQPITPFENDIIYVDLTRISRQVFNAELARLQAAAGIIFDMRGLPKMGNSAMTLMIQRLLPRPAHTLQWLIAEVMCPDRYAVRFKPMQQTLEPVQPTITGRLAFLIDDRTVGFTENLLSIVAHDHLGAMIGQPTGGTCGNSDYFSLLGTFDISWTALKVLKQDGSQHHGVGIAPTQSATRTLAGVDAGHDDILIQAIDWITHQQKV